MSFETVRAAYGVRADDYIEAVGREFAAIGQRTTGKLVYVSISDSAARPPDERTRKALVQLAEDMQQYYESCYVVLRAESFKGSVLRSAMAGMLLMSKHRKNVHVVGTIDEVLHAERGKLGADESRIRRQLQLDGVMTPVAEGA